MWKSIKQIITYPKNLSKKGITSPFSSSQICKVTVVHRASVVSMLNIFLYVSTLLNLFGEQVTDLTIGRAVSFKY